jgi:hypothetical protein
MSNLIPQKRPDKNGRMVTRHVRTDATRAGRTVGIPSPAASANPVKPLKLLARQTRDNSQVFDRDVHFPNSALKRLLPVKGKPLNYDIRASDATLYDMFSVLAVDDAIHLAHMGYPTKETALSFLHDNKLESLIREDRSSVMQEALQRRIPAAKFAELHAKYGIDQRQTDIFLDAAEAYSSSVLRNLSPYDELRSVHVGILAGDIDLSDIKSIGIGKIQKSNAAHRVIDALRRKKSGEIKCTAEDIAILIDKNNDENNVSLPLDWALGAIGRYGADFLTTLTNLRFASVIAEQCDQRKYSVEDTKSLIDYSGRMRSAGSVPSFPAMVKIKKAGVDPELAGRLHREGKTTEQIIEISDEGISAAVSSGWL